MKTKIVYVLTCSPCNHYIEQALMSVYSARFWNPTAQIVLIVDNLTDKLFEGTRAEILNYISEKIVVPFDDSLSMIYRSRVLKTSIRQRIAGDFVFVDCDTIICQALDELDSLDCLIGAVLDEHVPCKEYHNSLTQVNQDRASLIDFDYNMEDKYFNSGVMFVKDCPPTHILYEYWNRLCVESFMKNVQADQPALGKANTLCDHIISELPGIWNSIVFMRPKWIHESKIIHFWNYRNVSIMYTNVFLEYIARNGLTEYSKTCILNSIDSMPPFRTIVNDINLFLWAKMPFSISSVWKKYNTNIPGLYKYIPWPISKTEKMLLRSKLFFLSALLFSMRLFVSSRKKPVYDDICWGL